jgi:hypothetical protein
MPAFDACALLEPSDVLLVRPTRPPVSDLLPSVSRVLAAQQAACAARELTRGSQKWPHGSDSVSFEAIKRFSAAGPRVHQ